MERVVYRTARWIALATIVSPSAVCWADSPTPTVESPTINVEPTERAAEPNVETEAKKDVPLFRHPSYPDAWTAAQESNRPILVYVSMPQCPHCTQMIDKSYGTPEVSELVKGSFETLQVGRYSHPTLVAKLHVRWYPTTVIVGTNNKILDVIEGYVDAHTLKRRLQLGVASANTSTQTRK